MTRTPSGGAILCRTRAARQHCSFCYHVSVALCDARLEPGKTCDARLCERHRVAAGRDRDYCLDHAFTEPDQLELAFRGEA